MREVGLEPTRLAAREPKSRTAANYATPAYLSSLMTLISQIALTGVEPAF